MLAAQRRERILVALDRDGAVTVAGLAKALDVSEMTVRRDLDALHAGGQLHKVHGGATQSRAGSGREPGFSAKAALAGPAKMSIAREAARMVEPGATVGLTAGTTTVHVAQRLLGLKGITVVTNSIRVAEVFHDTATYEIPVIVTGGSRTPSDALVGPMAVSALRQLHLDICFMGVHGMDEHAGFTTPNLLEADTNRAFAENARQFVVVADSSKWGEIGLARITPLADASCVITDSGLAKPSRQILTSQVDRVIFTQADEDPHA